ncbi:MAG: hypothetical protein ABSE77_13620 [Acidimicrobiales bacterium]
MSTFDAEVTQPEVSSVHVPFFFKAVLLCVSRVETMISDSGRNIPPG